MSLQLPLEDPQTIDLGEQLELISEVHWPSMPQVLIVQESPSSHDASSVHGVTGVELQFCSLSKLHPVPNDMNHQEEDVNEYKLKQQHSTNQNRSERLTSWTIIFQLVFCA